ncbi:MAG: hypothetical protein D6816_17330 [Bacteroidetes bacterium]|nr:MAG: hypothetical protein D6816_17330 [Bacteroidota bacterium]
MFRKSLLLWLFLLLSLTAVSVSGAPTAAVQLFTYKEKLLASDKQGSAEFGTAVALSSDGKIMVVGARLQDVNGQSNQGQVYVFKRNADDTWSQAQILKAADGAANDEFGTAVAIAGLSYTIVVGAPGDNSGTGSAYVFTYNGSVWDAGTKLPISTADPESNDARGTAVAVSSSGIYAFVGAPGGGTGSPASGAVFVMKNNGVNWSLSQTLNGPTGGKAGMGRALLLNDNSNLLFTAGLYAPSGPILDHGAVHVYQKLGVSWTYDEMLSASDTSSNNQFGLGMAITADESVLFVGAPTKGTGRVYVFSQGVSTWSEDAIISRPAGAIYSNFGQSVALDSAGKVAAVGAWLNGSGGIFYYERSGASWLYQQTLNTFDSRQEHLGYALAMTGSGDMIIGGARSAHSGAAMDSVGAVYTYVPAQLVYLPIIVK